MRKVILLLGLVLQVIIVDAQSVSGSLVDEKGNPVSFANVVLLSSKDSSFVQGTISNESFSALISKSRFPSLIFLAAFCNFCSGTDTAR